MPPRSKPGELPKPVLKQGNIGGLPVNVLTLSGLHHGRIHCLLGFRDTEQTRQLKNRSGFHLVKNRKKVTILLDGRFFNGYSDALYRGQLPEVILAAPSADLLPDYLNDFVDYVEKLAALGFFLPKKQLLQRDAVSELIPCTILVGGGLLFSRFITGLLSALKALRHEYPSLDEQTRLRILGRFVRGFPVAGDPDAFSGPATLPVLGASASLIDFPCTIRIAGGDARTQARIQAVLLAQGIDTAIEGQSERAAERLELENALWRLSDVILPGLVSRELLSPAEAEALAPKLREGIRTIGLRREVLSNSEQPVPSGVMKKASGTSKHPEPVLGWGDVAIMAGLNGYARDLNLTDEIRLFEKLTQQVLSCCQPEQT